MKVYSTHGSFSTLERIRELEVEDRGNDFINPPYPDSTPALWVCIKPEDCFYYEPNFTLENLTEITIEDKHTLCNYDGNGGFLLLSPILQVK